MVNLSSCNLIWMVLVKSCVQHRDDLECVAILSSMFASAGKSKMWIAMCVGIQQFLFAMLYNVTRICASMRSVVPRSATLHSVAQHFILWNFPTFFLLIEKNVLKTCWHVFRLSEIISNKISKLSVKVSRQANICEQCSKKNKSLP